MSKRKSIYNKKQLRIILFLLALSLAFKYFYNTHYVDSFNTHCRDKICCNDSKSESKSSDFNKTSMYVNTANDSAPNVASDNDSKQTNAPVASLPDFTKVAAKATMSVVNIKCKFNAKTIEHSMDLSPLDKLFKDFFGNGIDIAPREYKNQPPPVSGSGVIVSADGYIVTNNHVIEGADEIEVTLHDNRRHNAKLIGKDPDTDLALLKINENNLLYLQFGDSDKLQVGQWVLAVGNPYNLSSTVTKGIVSALYRNLKTSIGESKNAVKIESFIQTDAAVNRGNSGGALITTNGNLVGITTAIIAPAGGFVGHSFAIPTAIAQPVVNDLKKFGSVQRAALGVVLRDFNADLVEDLIQSKKLKKQPAWVHGIYVVEVVKGSAAAEAGIKAEDIIVNINGEEIQNTSQLYEQILRYKPNDKINITFYRNDKPKTVALTLESKTTPLVVQRKDESVEVGGAEFSNTVAAIQKKFKIIGGVVVKDIKDGPFQSAGLRNGYVVLYVDKKYVDNIDTLYQVINGKDEVILVQGLDTAGKEFFYTVDLRNKAVPKK